MTAQSVSALSAAQLAQVQNEDLRGPGRRNRVEKRLPSSSRDAARATMKSVKDVRINWRQYDTSDTVGANMRKHSGRLP